MQKLQNQNNSSKILSKYNIETSNQILAKNIKDAIIFAKKNGFPLFLKIDSENISHKKDLGLVSKVSTSEELIKEFRRILSEANKHSSNINGILIQEFIEGPEFIMGIKNDPTFGKVIMFGTGGTYTEIFKDVSFRLCPIDKKEALRMIKETKGFEIMHSRGNNIDEDKIAKTLSSLSQLAIKENIEGLDINPFIAGRKYAAVDVKIIKKY